VKWGRSALTTTLLAIAAIAPAASIAAEPDTSQEGGGVPEQVLDPDSDSPSFDPGGETDLPYETGTPSPQESPDAAPLESEPVDDPEGRAAPLAPPQPHAPGNAEDVPVPPPEQAPPVAPAPGFSIEPPTSAPTPPPAESVSPENLGAEPASGPKTRRLTWTLVESVNRSQQDAEATPAAEPIDASAGSEPTGHTETATARNHIAASRNPRADNRRIHIVAPGESLWSIAEGLIGHDASATRIAAEVARLWELNRDRIPSGDPDLIAVGQQLKLR
jgi:hypothetical protein